MDPILTIFVSLVSGSIGALLTLFTEKYRMELKIISILREKQFTLYSELWSSLYDLKVAGDLLWRNANKTNLKKFEKQLDETETKINKSSLLIEENDIRSLREIIFEFLNFQIGKQSLLNLRKNKNRYRSINNEVIGYAVEENEVIKNRYDDLIYNIETTLRDQLRTI